MDSVIITAERASDDMQVSSLANLRDVLQRKVERERRGRKEAEDLLNTKSLELWSANQKLKESNRILEQKIVERTKELQVMVDRLQAVIYGSRSFVWESKSDGDFYLCNELKNEFDICSRKYTRLSQMLKKVATRDVARQVIAALRDSLATGRTSEIRVQLKHKSGARNWYRLIAVPVNSGGEKHIVGSIVDINDSVVKEQTIRRLVEEDYLTGLANRRSYFSEIERRLEDRSSRKFGVVLIDLNSFKEINDTWGHNVGDAVLKEVGQRIARRVRSGDIVARIGGDEFAAVLDAIDNESAARKVLGDLADILTFQFSVRDASIPISVSIGFATVDDSAAQREELLNNADLAMYRAKRNRKAAVSSFEIYERGMEADAVEQRQRANTVRMVIDREQIALHYQPQIDIKTGRVHGYEALMRWYEKPGEWMTPSEFIATAERKGLIREITGVVIRKLCEDYAANRQQMVASALGSVICSMNISVEDVRDENFLRQLIELTGEYGVPPEFFGVEITETRLMENIAVSAEVIGELSRHGFSVAIDDFGKGYCSLQYLNKLPIANLKIDRDFISDLHACDSSRQIVGTVIQLAHSLNINCIAEGVENELQLEILRELGCDLAQGFFIARPAPFEDALEWAMASVKRASAFGAAAHAGVLS